MELRRCALSGQGGKMKRGFTLLELIIVIIIIGVLATLGFTQYGRMVERARGAEAKSILGDLRKLAAVYYLEHNSLTGLNNHDNLNIGTQDTEIPSTCRQSHYFSYNASVSGDTATLTATRCKGSGKTPDYKGTDAPDLKLESNIKFGTDTWSGDY